MKALLLALFFTLPVFAKAEETAPHPEEILETIAPVALRESTPDPDFGGKAARVGWLKKGEQVKVLGMKQYISILGTEIWLEVQKVSDPSIHGWVLAGTNQDLQQGKSPLGRPVPAEVEQSAPADSQE